MKKVYIVLSQSGSKISKLLKFFTRDQYNHVSISLDEKLSKMYSFARLNPRNPFIGGFVEETYNSGMYKSFPQTKILVNEIEVTDEQYLEIEKSINRFMENRAFYHYNFMGIFLGVFKRNLKRNHHYYCSQFVRKILEDARVIKRTDLPVFVKPINFLNISKKECIYQGDYCNYFV